MIAAGRAADESIPVRSSNRRQAATTALHRSWPQFAGDAKLMFIPVRNPACSHAKFLRLRVEGDDIDAVIGRKETVEPKPSASIVLEQLVNDVSVIGGRCSVQRLGSALIARKHGDQVAVSAITLVPHLLRRVSSFAVNLGPRHPAFCPGDVLVACRGPMKRSPSHVRSDHGPTIGVLVQHLVRPIQHIVRCIAFQVQKYELHSACRKELITVGVVSGNLRTLRCAAKEPPYQSNSSNRDSGKNS